MEGAMVVMDQQDGAVRVLVGGRDYYESSYNRATEVRPRSPWETWPPLPPASDPGASCGKAGRLSCPCSDRLPRMCTAGGAAPGVNLQAGGLPYGARGGIVSSRGPVSPCVRCAPVHAATVADLQAASCTRLRSLPLPLRYCCCC